MSNHSSSESAALIRAFSDRQPADLRDDCPAADDIYEAVAGRLPEAQGLTVVDHVTECAACAGVWRLAGELQGMRMAPAAPRSVVSRFAALAAAAAVALVAGVVVMNLDRTQPADPVYRSGDGAASLQSRVAAQALPRESFVLRWSSGSPGATYTLRVTDSGLEPLLVETDLSATEFHVPASALAGVPSGTQVLWQVEARHTDGVRVNSSTYSVTLR